MGIFPWHKGKKQEEQKPQQQDPFAALDAMTSGLLAGNEAKRENGVASRDARVDQMTQETSKAMSDAISLQNAPATPEEIAGEQTHQKKR
ncbi:MAG: hypothetical protein J6Y42_02165 [Bacilli bacterium]|nr:hypothetical protein [Bacilli bacterium]